MNNLFKNNNLVGVIILFCFYYHLFKSIHNGCMGIEGMDAQELSEATASLQRKSNGRWC